MAILVTKDHYFAPKALKEGSKEIKLAFLINLIVRASACYPFLKNTLIFN